MTEEELMFVEGHLGISKGFQEKASSFLDS